MAGLRPSLLLPPALLREKYLNTETSVSDPDPYIFGPPGSRSGSFYRHAKIIKIVRKTLIPTTQVFCDFFWTF
jgi:hypothetical protein